MITIIKAQPTLRPASLLWRFISCLRGRDVIDLGKKYNLTFRSRVVSSDGAISRSARYMQVWGRSVILCSVQKMSFVHYKDFRCMVSGDTSYNICRVSGALKLCLSRPIQRDKDTLSFIRFLLLFLPLSQKHGYLQKL